MYNLKNRLAVAAVGLLLIAPTAISHGEASAAGTSTPPPDPTSAYCTKLRAAVEGIQKANQSNGTASPDTTVVLAALASGLKGMAGAPPPDFLASQVTQQATYWQGASDAIKSNSIFSPLLSKARLTAETASLQALMDSSMAYCGLSSSSASPSASKTSASPSSSASPSVPKTSASPSVPKTSASPSVPKTSASPSVPKTSASPSAPKTSAPPTPAKDSVVLRGAGLSSNGSSLSVGNAKTVTQITVTSTGVGKWTAEASPGQKWLKVTRGKGTSGDTFKVVAKKNRGVARTGTVTVTLGTATATVTVNQAAA